MVEIYEYDAYLSFEKLDGDSERKLERIFRQAGLDVSVGPTHLEFMYKGRDTGREVVKIFVKAARVIHDAVGEILCQPSVEAEDPVFEFYSIEDGNLFCQVGRVSREKRSRVCWNEPGADLSLSEGGALF